MSEFEQWSVGFGALALLFNLGLLIVVVVEMRLLGRQITDARRVTELDFQRRREQATIEFFAVTLEKRSELRRVLPSDRDRAAVETLVASASQDQEAQMSIIEYLNVIELLAAGVNSDVFDITTVDRIAGGRIRAIASNYRGWIENEQQVLEAPKLYENIFRLAASLEGKAD